MQKENPVIKNYIYSSEKRIVGTSESSIRPEISKYRIPLGQNTVYFYFFLL